MLKTCKSSSSQRSIKFKDNMTCKALHDFTSSASPTAHFYLLLPHSLHTVCSRFPRTNTSHFSRLFSQIYHFRKIFLDNAFPSSWYSSILYSALFFSRALFTPNTIYSCLFVFYFPIRILTLEFPP